MVGEATRSTRTQETVSSYFDDHVNFWDDVYRSSDVFSVIHQQRRERALMLVDSLGLTAGSRVLEVGCGTGRFAVALASRGFRVDAIDASPAMVRATQERARQEEFDGVLRCRQADVQRLDLDKDQYQLVVALGVVPWVPDPPVALREMARVLEPGGHLLLSADNRHRLTYALDPRFQPFLEPARAALRSRLAAAGRRPTDESIARPALHSRADLDRLLGGSGLTKTVGLTLGFGPLTFLGRQVLPASVTIRINQALQRSADAGTPVVRTLGTQHLVLARKSTSRHGAVASRGVSIE
jgi:ubiquinone/menaquinone biosynthesis C-methylase UbiE